MSRALPTVFIPALLCDARQYQHVITALGDRIEPEVMLSPKSTFEESVADLLSRAPESFVLVGTSYGGNLALQLALAAPERVLALWLMGCDPAASPAGAPNLAAGLEQNFGATVEQLAGRVVRAQATEATTTFKAMAHEIGQTAGVAQARANARRSDVTLRLHTLRQPALMLWGAEDAAVPVAVGRQLAAQVPNAQFSQLGSCGHLPTLESPEQCAQRFGAFLQEAVSPLQG